VVDSDGQREWGPELKPLLGWRLFRGLKPAANTDGQQQRQRPIQGSFASLEDDGILGGVDVRATARAADRDNARTNEEADSRRE